MVSFRDQMDLHKASRMATAALEVSSRSAISRIFQAWDDGELSAVSVRYRLENIVRAAYRSSASVARGVAQGSSGIDEWKSHEVFNTSYLQDLLSDIRRNLRDYKRGILSREQAISRMEHGAGVAAQRGYTDQIIASYTELEDFGLELKKYWVANFIDNEPCPSCTRLHGTSVGLHESFRAEVGESGVYRDLIGPPRHPRCQCRLYIFTITLDNAFQEPNFESPQQAPTMMTASQVRSMPKGIFKAVISSLKAILKFLRRK